MHWDREIRMFVATISYMIINCPASCMRGFDCTCRKDQVNNTFAELNIGLIGWSIIHAAMRTVAFSMAVDATRLVRRGRGEETFC